MHARRAPAPQTHKPKKPKTLKPPAALRARACGVQAVALECMRGAHWPRIPEALKPTEPVGGEQAVALECMRGAHRQQRACYLYAFSGPGDVQELELTTSAPSLTQLLAFLRNRRAPHQALPGRKAQAVGSWTRCGVHVRCACSRMPYRAAWQRQPAHAHLLLTPLQMPVRCADIWLTFSSLQSATEHACLWHEKRTAL